jgi:quaternary ammonium compound-resistance protein SugE
MDSKSLALGVVAALMYSVGAVLMKPSEGLSRLLPTVGMLTLFVLGAAVNALIVHRSGEIGPAYLMVLGCETLLAYVLGVVVFAERVTIWRLAAVGMILVGIVVLSSSEQDQTAIDPIPVDVAR